MSNKYDFFSFSQTKTNWSWQEILYGMENKIIARSDVINYATRILDEGILGFDWVLKIAIADEYEDILPYIYELGNLEDSEDDSTIQDKWRYFILKELYAKKSNYENFNEKVEEIYADFDYPEDMAGFIGYMPSLDGKSMEESWQEYLTSSKGEFEN
ncbi:TPA: DUF2247 family protein [Enterococcus faecalis]|uniref:DUF2247 family protein n=1 Tax=Enterococcus TaxID=1350 RepID=UPI00046C8609|nr:MULTISPECIES: DUF2247 family protein [Enterococcus]EGO8079894.1 DUF2247 family protein [Enterococcus faecalis]EGO8222888.1 DUF2247 family protein [Enterococcus faecalis]EHR4851837.1 DUF2247 family protein [Enterococcus faecalis]EHU9665913.1 DUF2247 family protein [Enterococcus faecalis]EIA7727739.1 DUF2247 family protein [Enterococcus faecalis]